MIDAQFMRNLAGAVEEILNGSGPSKTGFVILTFPTGKPGTANYIGNCDRADVITALREAADRLENRQDHQSVEPN